jgi:LAGLIDADG-like domain/Terminase large subunit, T4likevirus-type, N-terminal
MGWKPPLSPKQMRFLQMCHRKPGGTKFNLMSGPRQSTKCVDPETIVWTADGLSRIEDLGAANERQFSPIAQGVVSYDTATSALAVGQSDAFYNSGHNNTISIELRNGYKITTSEQHPLWCEHNGTIGYLTASDILDKQQNGTKVWIPIVVGHPHFSRLQYQKVRYSIHTKEDTRRAAIWMAFRAIHNQDSFPAAAVARMCGTTTNTILSMRRKAWIEPAEREQTIDEDLAYAMGLLVGDGCMTHKVLKSGMPGFSTGDQELLASLASILSQRFLDFTIKHRIAYDYVLSSRDLKRFLFHIHLAGLYAHEKTVPREIINSPPSVVRAFLQGLFDTDGTADKRIGYVSFCSSSERLSRDVQSLLLAFGIQSKVVFYKNAFKGAWMLYVGTWSDKFYQDIGFRLPRKQALRSKQRLGKPHSVSRVPSFPPSIIGHLKRIWGGRVKRGLVGAIPKKIIKIRISTLINGYARPSPRSVSRFMELLRVEHDPGIDQYTGGGRLWWQEIKNIVRSAGPLVDISVPRMHNFIGNGFINHNTIAGMHSIAEHLWDVPDARFSTVAKTVTNAEDAGFWTELCMVVIPQWIAAGLKSAEGHKMEWVTKPKQRGVTKKLYFQVSNRHGGVSHCQLDSLLYEQDAEDRFKGKMYSGIYVSELSGFKRRETFDVWRQALRGQRWEEWQTLFIGDTNPAEEGKESWIWKLWWEERMREPDSEQFREWQRQLGLMEFSVADNIFKDEAWHRTQAAMYAWSDDLLRRYYHGEWVMATSNSIFHDVFRPVAHIVGEPETPVNNDPEVLLPDPNCSELITGWDLGVSNHAFALIHKRWAQVMGKDGKPRDISIFDVIDEVVYLKSDSSIDDFIDEALGKIAYWEEYLGREVFWRNWSDRSAFDMRGGVGNVLHHQLVRQISQGKIILQSVDRSPGSMKQRVELVKRLLFENRIYISKSRCPFLIDSFQGLPPGKAGRPININSHFKHIFDAFSYAVVSESFDELFSHQGVNVGKSSRSGVVSLTL